MLASFLNDLRTASAVPSNHLSPSLVCSAAKISTKPLLKILKLYVFLICEFNEDELNCVNTKILLNPELRQFEMGISTKRYFPAIGTAGLDRWSVNGYRREPLPPPKTIATTL
ncbi:hypothetical protein D3C80_998040 [compost metagenome]